MWSYCVTATDGLHTAPEVRFKSLLIVFHTAEMKGNQ